MRRVTSLEVVVCQKICRLSLWSSCLLLYVPFLNGGRSFSYTDSTSFFFFLNFLVIFCSPFPFVMQRGTV